MEEKILALVKEWLEEASTSWKYAMMNAKHHKEAEENGNIEDAAYFYEGYKLAMAKRQKTFAHATKLAEVMGLEIEMDFTNRKFKIKEVAE